PLRPSARRPNPTMMTGPSPGYANSRVSAAPGTSTTHRERKPVRPVSSVERLRPRGHSRSEDAPRTGACLSEPARRRCRGDRHTTSHRRAARHLDTVPHGGVAPGLASAPGGAFTMTSDAADSGPADLHSADAGSADPGSTDAGP